MKIALIGVGHVAAYQIEALRRSPAWEIAGAADLDPARARSLADDVPFYAEADALLEHTAAEVCLVATGHAAHFELGRRVLLSGRHLILEKPCCSTLGEFETLLDIAERSGRQLFVALHAAHGLEVQWLAANREALATGKLSAFVCRFSDPYWNGGRLNPAAVPLGGAWIDSGINALSVVATQFPASRLSVAEADIGGKAPPVGLDVRSLARFTTHPPACSGSIETRWDLGLNSKTTRLEFAGSGIDILLDHAEESVVIRRRDRPIETIVLKNGLPRLTNHYVGVFDEAHRALATGNTNASAALVLRRLVQAAVDQPLPRT